MYIPEHYYKIVTDIDREYRFQYEDDSTGFEGISYVELPDGTRYDVPADDLKKGIFNRARKIIAPFVLPDIRSSINFLLPFIPKRKTGKVSIKRYFVKHKVTGQIVELDIETYTNLFTDEPSHVAFGELDWYIAGPLYDINNSNFLQEGTTTKNARGVDKLENNLPGIKFYVRDLTFLSDPQYVTQTPQTNQTLNIIVPSPS